MPSKEKLRKNIAQVRNFQVKLIKTLGRIEQDSREEMVNQDYSNRMTLIAPWVNLTKMKEIVVEGTNISQNKIDYVVKVSKAINRINSSPDQKEHILNQFLQELEVISDSDRVVLLESFKELPQEDLQGELINICQIFMEE